MAQAKTGDTVKVHYTGSLDDGTEFDSSKGREPLEFILGEGRVIPGFELAVLGMDVGDSKTVRIPAKEAYGPYRDDLVIVVDRASLPDDMDPKKDDMLELRRGEQSFGARVTDTSPDNITLDANHALAGQDLTFEIELMEIA